MTAKRSTALKGHYLTVNFPVVAMFVFFNPTQHKRFSQSIIKRSWRGIRFPFENVCSGYDTD